MQHNRVPGITCSVLCFFAATVLTVFPLPDSMGVWRPHWVALFVCLWMNALPGVFGMVYAFLCGLVLDVVLGAPLGVNALCLTLLAFLFQFNYLRIRGYTQLQLAGVAMLAVVIYQLAHWLLLLILGQSMSLYLLFTSALSTGVAWLLLFAPIDRLQRRYGITS